MTFRRGADVSDFKMQVRRFIDANLTPATGEAARESGTFHDWTFHRALAEARWVVAPWPRDQGGDDRTPVEMMVLVNELSRADAPIEGWLTTLIVANTVRHVGTDWQRSQVLPAVIGGEALCCLGFSEPDAGSDLAAAATRAVRAEQDKWIIDGQKIFTSFAHAARWVLLLARTDPDVPTHRGLTTFLVPLDSPGISIQPINTLGGERLNLVFYDSVSVDDRWRIGAVGGGWKVLMTSLAFERGGAGGGSAKFIGTLDRLVGLVGGLADDVEFGGLLEDPVARERYARVAVDLEVSRLLGVRSALIADRGETPVVEAAMAKLFASEALQRASSYLLNLLGPRGQLQHDDPQSPLGGAMEHIYRDSVSHTIIGGTSEMMRTIIATQGLGLPRG